MTVGGYDGLIAVGDVNGDGNPDVIAANSCVDHACTQGNVGVLLGNGDGSFQPVRRRAGTGGWRGDAVALVDINRDGVLDVLAANPCRLAVDCTLGSVGLLLGRGDGTFLPATSYSSGGTVLTSDRIAVMDVNGDGTPDVFVSGANKTVGVLLSLFDTKTNLSSNQNMPAYGQELTLTATVDSNGPVAPTGTVLFLKAKSG